MLERDFPDETAQTTFGIFGYGSEVLGMDDEYSHDHHWGIRINALMPDALYQARHAEIMQCVGAQIPSTWRGHPLQEGYSQTGGLEIASLQGHLLRTIGIDHPPKTTSNGCTFPKKISPTSLRVRCGTTHSAIFPPCASLSALLSRNRAPAPHRALVPLLFGYGHVCAQTRDFARQRLLRQHHVHPRPPARRAGLAFLLDKQYFPYDKWTFAYFEKLPRMSRTSRSLRREAVRLETPWARKLELLNEMSDVFDATMVEDGIIAPHPKFRGSESSGYRVLEHAYAEILKQLPPSLQTTVPIWDQIYFEGWHSGYVTELDMRTWDGLLNLTKDG